MKKMYEKPVAEKVEFDYSRQVVVASGCRARYTENPTPCASPKIDSYINDHA